MIARSRSCVCVCVCEHCSCSFLHLLSITLSYVGGPFCSSCASRPFTYINDWNTAFNAYLMQRITTLSLLSAFSVWLCRVRLLPIHSTSLAIDSFCSRCVCLSVCVCVCLMTIYNLHRTCVIDFVSFAYDLHRRHRVRACKRWFH